MSILSNRYKCNCRDIQNCERCDSNGDIKMRKVLKVYEAISNSYFVNHDTDSYYPRETGMDKLMNERLALANNEAFSKMINDYINSIKKASDRERLREILSIHIIK